MTPKVMIGVPTAEYARRADFYDYLNILNKPGGTLCTLTHGQSPARGRNIMVHQALETNCTHFFTLDDDMAFSPDTLIRLLEHDKDIVSAFYLMRAWPHQPILFNEVKEDGGCIWYYPEDKDKGLISILNCGLGCVLINMDVFKKMPEPWFTLGEYEKDHWCDDITFFNRARKLGFNLFCDLDVVTGHMASVTVWPTRASDGSWNVTYDSFGRGQISFPQPKA